MILMHDVMRNDNPVLRQVAELSAFPSVDGYKELADKTMQYLTNSQGSKIAEKHQLRTGVGLAAPQVGKSIRMATLLAPNDKGEIIFKEVFVNPKTISESVKKACLAEGEGCLGVDKDIEGYVPHPDKLKTHYYTVDGGEKTIRLKDYPTIVASYETDYLNGHLFYDRANKQDPFDLAGNTIAVS